MKRRCEAATLYPPYLRAVEAGTTMKVDARKVLLVLGIASCLVVRDLISPSPGFPIGGVTAPSVRGAATFSSKEEATTEALDSSNATAVATYQPPVGTPKVLEAEQLRDQAASSDSKDEPKSQDGELEHSLGATSGSQPLVGDPSLSLLEPPVQTEYVPDETERESTAQASHAAATESQGEDEPERSSHDTLAPVQPEDDTSPQPDPPIQPRNVSYQVLRERDFPRRPVSPYELRERGRWDLAPWAEKPFFFWGVKVPANKSVCLVHVGKTAGSALGCSLGFQLHCHDDMWYPSGVLSKYTTNMIHNGVNDCWDDMGYYMFTLRDPIARIKSWFAYEKPGGASGNGPHGRERLFEECPFPTLNALAEQGLGEMENVSATCHGRAWRAIAGTERFGYHAYFNYRSYADEIRHWDDVKIAAIRQEHMVDDWNSMETLLSGNPTPVVREFPRRNSYGKKDPDDDYLSPRARVLVCEALCNEILVYRSILRRAVNLTPSDVRQSMNELRASCPAQADLRSCPPNPGDPL